MPRPSYEEHRARKRRQSFESETDAGSLASFTTHQSTSSFQPTYTYASSPRLTVPKQRTLSSTSASSSTSPRLQSFVPPPAPRVQNPSLLHVGIDEATRKRREARRQRREERERKSTLKGDEYDTRLRRVVRWISKKGWRGRGMGLAALVWVLLRWHMESDGLGQHLTLHRYRFESISARIPYLGPALIGLSDRNFLTLIVFLNAVCENALWYGPIIEWTRTQGKLGGRSWRSQVIAVVSILLAPAFFLSSTQHIISAQIPLGLCACALLFLTNGHDQRAADAILLATILESRWGISLPAIFTFSIARCIGRGRIQGAWSFVQVVISPVRLFVVKSLVEGTFSRTSWPVLKDGFMVKWVYDGMLGKHGIYASHSPSIWCVTDVVFRWTSWLSATTINTISSTLIFITLAPILGIIFYAACSTPPTPAHTIQPGATILTITLFTSSLTLILLLPNLGPEALVVPLLPLSLMSCMRGGKDDLGDGAEWEWTVLLHTVVTSYFAATGHAGARMFGVPALAIWNYLLSSRSPPKDISSLRKSRETIEVVCMGLYAVTFLVSTTRIPLWEEGWCVLVFGVLVVAWMWGVSKLYLTAWASGLLGRRDL